VAAADDDRRDLAYGHVTTSRRHVDVRIRDASGVS
jgi:hypothetical protein